MLNRDDPKPLYEQLEDILRTSIKDKVWLPNQIIPSENELAKMYGLSRMTVRSVIINLTKEGLLYRVQGKGTFVAPPKIEATQISSSSFFEQVKNCGYDASSEVLGSEVITGDRAINHSLELRPDGQVFCLYRSISVNGELVCVTNSYIPVQISSKIFTSSQDPIMDLSMMLRKVGYETHSVDETVKARYPSKRECDLLNCRRDHPLLSISSIHRTPDGRPFLRNDSSFRAERIEIKYNLTGDYILQ